MSSLRLLGGGTAPMTTAQVHAIRDGFRCRDMVILYGSTEAGPVSVLRPPDVARKPETVGRPYLDVDVRLVDDDGTRRSARRRRRDRSAQRVHDARLLAQSRGDGAHEARRLGAHRRSRRVRRRGFPLRRRAPEGGHPQRRREHLPRRDRARAARTPRRPRGERRRHSGRTLGRGGRRRDRARATARPSTPTW